MTSATGPAEERPALPIRAEAGCCPKPPREGTPQGNPPLSKAKKDGSIEPSTFRARLAHGGDYSTIFSGKANFS